MKLISFTYSPDGNIAGYKAQFVIDPQPGVFKAAYLHIVQDMAGDISIAFEPYGSSEAQCDRAIAFSRRVLAGVTTLVEPLEGPLQEGSHRDMPEDQRHMLKSHVCQIINAMEPYPSLTDIAHALYREAGYQPFPWHKDDIRCAWADKHDAEIEDCPLSDAACMDILERLHRNHDASIGINWDVIACYLDEVAS
jgi:hypothetical protein